MKRAFKAGYIAIAATATPQPLLAATLTDAVFPSSVPQNVVVNDSSYFQNGDWVLMADYSGAKPVVETLQVISIPDATHVKVGGLQGQGITNAYTTGGFLILSGNFNNVYIQTKDGNAGSVYVGTEHAMSSSTGAYCIAQLTKVTSGSQPTDILLQEPVGRDPETPSNFWIEGTAADSYLVTLGRD